MLRKRVEVNMRLKTLSLYLTVPLVFSYKTKKILKRFLKAENRKKKKKKKEVKKNWEKVNGA